MAPQQLSWTCSVCSFNWVIGATGTATLTRDECLAVIGHPECVNATYGCMSAQCLLDAYATFGLAARQAWLTFDQAYAIARITTGQINPMGMYHYMAIRGVDGANLWLANSAPGYLGVGEIMTREQYNQFGPVQLIYLAPEQNP